MRDSIFTWGEGRDFIDVDRVNFLCLNFKPENLVIVMYFLFLPKKGGLNWNQHGDIRKRKPNHKGTGTRFRQIKDGDV